MSEIDNGGPAFPQTSYSTGTVTEDGGFIPFYETTGGMTLRAYAAVKIMAALAEGGSMASWRDDAEAAVKEADTIIAELKKGGAA